MIYPPDDLWTQKQSYGLLEWKSLAPIQILQIKNAMPKAGFQSIVKILQLFRTQMNP